MYRWKFSGKVRFGNIHSKHDFCAWLVASANDKYYIGYMPLLKLEHRLPGLEKATCQQPPIFLHSEIKSFKLYITLERPSV